jgi:DUF1365 family protein
MRSCLYECKVMHARFAPKANRFLYRIFLFAIDLDELPELHRRLPWFSVNRRNVYAFDERDYLPVTEPLHPPAHPALCHVIRENAPGLKTRVLAYLAERGVDLGAGRVVLVTLPRVFGYLFNPVSFYFCYDRDGRCVAALSEVTNTFREMKPFFLGPKNQANDVFRLRVPKHFYVSPFSDVDVEFDFILRPPTDRLSIQIDDYAGDRRMLTSTLTGPQRALTGARLAWYTIKYPLLTLRIVGLIHWHALLLWLKRNKWFPKAARATEQRDLYRPHASLAKTPDAA